MWTPLGYLELSFFFYDNTRYEVLTIEIDQDSLLNALTVRFVRPTHFFFTGHF